MSKLTTLEKAKKSIAKLYVFDEKSYPVLAKLNVTERKVFAVNHILLHLQINLYTFLDELRLIPPPDIPLGNEEILKDVSVRMLINILKLAEIADMPPFDPGVTRSYTYNGDWVECLLPLKAIATACETFNRSQAFDDSSVVKATQTLWKYFLGRIMREEFPASSETLLALIPEYMKSI